MFYWLYKWCPNYVAQYSPIHVIKFLIDSTTTDTHNIVYIPHILFISRFLVRQFAEQSAMKASSWGKKLNADERNDIEVV